MPPAVRNSITYSTSYSNLMPSLHPLRVQLHHHSQICCKHKQLPVQDSKPLVLSISESPSQLTWNSMYFFKSSIRCICLPNKKVPVSLITQGTDGISQQEGGLFWTTFRSESGVKRYYLDQMVLQPQASPSTCPNSAFIASTSPHLQTLGTS